MYQIIYFADPQMESRQPDTDSIPDAALASYPAPQFPETAIAVHSNDASLTRYGFVGVWHARPPREAVAAEQHARESAKRAAELADARALLAAQGIRIRRTDRGVRIVRYSGSQPQDSGQMCSWAQLTEACDQADAKASELYRAIRKLAKEH